MNNTAISTFPVRDFSTHQQDTSAAQGGLRSMRVIELEAECALLRLALAYKEKELAEKDALLRTHYDAREGLRAEVARYRWLRGNTTLHRSITRGFFEIRMPAPMEVPAGLDDLVDQVRAQQQLLAYQK
jgi:hypothetical protein